MQKVVTRVKAVRKATSPFGSIQVQENLSDFTNHFGRGAMYLQSGLYGLHSYPDRIYVLADPIGNVHHDTIFVLKKLFGNSISPKLPTKITRKGWEGGETILDFGVIPNIEVQTGRPDGYMTADLMQQSSDRRPPTGDEVDIAHRVCFYCYQFAKEHKLLGIKPSGGIFEHKPSLMLSAVVTMVMIRLRIQHGSKVWRNLEFESEV